jgi:hypothetical protein
VANSLRFSCKGRVGFIVWLGRRVISTINRQTTMPAPFAKEYRIELQPAKKILMASRTKEVTQLCPGADRKSKASQNNNIIRPQTKSTTECYADSGNTEQCAPRNPNQDAPSTKLLEDIRKASLQRLTWHGTPNEPSSATTGGSELCCRF